MEFKTAYCLTDDARAIREEVFIKEQCFINEFDEIDARAIHVVLYVEEKAAATGRTFQSDKDEQTYILGRIAVRKEYRGKNLGLAILEALEQHAKKAGARDAALSAQLQAKGFYEKAGYTAQGDIYKEEACPHVLMSKRL